MSTEEQQALAQRPASILQVIATAVTDPRMDVDKMRALFELQRDIVAEERRVAFDEAMTRVQSKLKPIAKLGQGKNSKFAKYEDLHALIQPLLAEEGFSQSFSQKEEQGDKIRFVLEVSRAGHSKTFELAVHSDKAATNREGKSIRPPIQDDGSTASYARRYLVKMAFNIVEKGEDTDGESPRAIGPDQVIEIKDLIRDSKSNEASFLELIAGVERIEDIQQRDYKRIVNALQTKMRVAK
jgi:hypothetical protein